MFSYAAVVPGRTGSYVPGRSAAYENQALANYDGDGDESDTKQKV